MDFKEEKKRLLSEIDTQKALFENRLAAWIKRGRSPWKMRNTARNTALEFNIGSLRSIVCKECDGLLAVAGEDPENLLEVLCPGCVAASDGASGASENVLKEVKVLVVKNKRSEVEYLLWSNGKIAGAVRNNGKDKKPWQAKAYTFEGPSATSYSGWTGAMSKLLEVICGVE